MGILLDNKILARAEMKLEGRLTPINRENYMRVVIGGLHVALNKGPDGLMAKLKTSPDPITDAVQGAIAIVLMMNHEVNKRIPPEALVPGTMGLVLQALDFVDRTGVMKIGAAELDKATHLYADLIFKMQGITLPMMNKAASMVQGITSDPAKMEIIHRKIGYTKDPGVAAIPTLPQTQGRQ